MHFVQRNEAKPLPRLLVPGRRERHCGGSCFSINLCDVCTAVAHLTSVNLKGLIWFAQPAHRSVLEDVIALHLSERCDSTIQTSLAGVDRVDLIGQTLTMKWQAVVFKRQNYLFDAVTLLGSLQSSYLRP